MCFYGWRGAHRHNDGLHLDLYAHGRALMPDTGYPDFMNALVPGIYTWSQATISHNTVTVDEKGQEGNPEGQVRRFLSTPSVQYCDLDGNGNYAQTTQYRRALVLVSVDATQAYVLDVFRVTGGRQHDYSLHGTVGARTVLKGQFGPAQTRGTLAGEQVAVGGIYDDPTLGAEGYSGGYAGYLGSGFQHLVTVRRQTVPGPVVLQGDPAEPPAVKLRMHLLPEEGRQVILAEAQVSPIKRTELLPFAIVRAQGEDLASTFVSVLEPFVEAPLIEAVEALPSAEDAVAVRVRRPGAVDTILQAPEPGTLRPAGDVFRSDAALAVVTSDLGGAWQRIVASGGTKLEIGGEVIPLNPAGEGRVTGVTAQANAITVAWVGPTPPVETLVGRHVLLLNDLRTSAFQVTGATTVPGGSVLVLRASLLNGRGRVTGLDDAGGVLKTDSRMLLQAKYRGMRVASEGLAGFLPILSAKGGAFTVRAEMPLSEVITDTTGDSRIEFWVSVTGPGDRLVLQAETEIERRD
jgi:hypothetical protein